MPQHLLRVDDPAGAFETLIAALRQEGKRVGWLELTPPSHRPPELEAAALSGVLRAVAVGDGRSVAVKPMRGHPVWRDLRREHFRGCELVLIRGKAQGVGGLETATLPRLEPHGADWRLEIAGETRSLDIRQLTALLGKARPWDLPGSST